MSHKELSCRKWPTITSLKYKTRITVTQLWGETCVFWSRSWRPTVGNTLVLFPAELLDMFLIRYLFRQGKSRVLSVGRFITAVLKCEGSFMTDLRRHLPNKCLYLFLPLHPLNSPGQTVLWFRFRECPAPSSY